MPIFSQKCIATLTLVVTLQNTFSSPLWALSEFSPYADTLASVGIIQTQSTDAGYRLGELVVRGEVAKIAMNLKGGALSGCTGTVYADVTASLGDLCGYVEAAAHAGIVSLAYRRFRYGDSITRAELVKMLLSANDIEPSSVPAGFSDVPGSMGDLALYVNAGVQMGCVKRQPLFQPNIPATRGEIFKVAVCIMEHKSISFADDGGSLVWSDEFSGSVLDTTKWSLETGSDGWGNNELENYTDNANVSLGDGKLTIQARRENSSGATYSSARINTHTKASWTYGKIEARIKLPTGQGIWPAFWMLGENIDNVDYPRCGEIDIVEMVGGRSAEDGSDNETIIWGTIHRPDYAMDPPETVKSIGTSFLHPNSERWSDDFHIYGIEWDDTSIRHSVDGRVYQTIDIDRDTDGFEVFHRPFYIVLNLAVGGNWPGSPDATTSFPQDMVVDWVRVYQK